MQATVLIAEDDLNHAELLARALDQTGYGWPVFRVTDGEEAIEYLSGHRQFADREKYPLPNILLLDLKMPRKSGFEVLEFLFDRSAVDPTFRNIRVIVLTTSDQLRDVNRAYQLGAASFLVKPVEYSEFKEMVSASVRYWTSMNIPGTVSAPPRGPLTITPPVLPAITPAPEQPGQSPAAS